MSGLDWFYVLCALLIAGPIALVILHQLEPFDIEDEEESNE